MNLPFSARASAVIGHALAGLVLVAAAASAPAAAQGPASAPAAVLREALVAGTPIAAPDQQLQLVRYVIQPGTTLPPHTHPGMQVCWIESGTLHYVVVKGGETPVHRQARAGGQTTVEMIRPGQKTDLHPGDTLVEAENVTHYGANHGDEPVVIWVAALLHAGKPPAAIAEAPRP